MAMETDGKFVMVGTAQEWYFDRMQSIMCNVDFENCPVAIYTLVGPNILERESVFVGLFTRYLKCMSQKRSISLGDASDWLQFDKDKMLCNSLTVASRNESNTLMWDKPFLISTSSDRVAIFVMVCPMKTTHSNNLLALSTKLCSCEIILEGYIDNNLDLVEKGLKLPMSTKQEIVETIKVKHLEENLLMKMSVPSETDEKNEFNLVNVISKHLLESIKKITRTPCENSMREDSFLFDDFNKEKNKLWNNLIRCLDYESYDLREKLKLARSENQTICFIGSNPCDEMIFINMLAKHYLQESPLSFFMLVDENMQKQAGKTTDFLLSCFCEEEWAKHVLSNSDESSWSSLEKEENVTIILHILVPEIIEGSDFSGALHKILQNDVLPNALKIVVCTPLSDGSIHDIFEACVCIQILGISCATQHLVFENECSKTIDLTVGNPDLQELCFSPSACQLVAEYLSKQSMAHLGSSLSELTLRLFPESKELKQSGFTACLKSATVAVRNNSFICVDTITPCQYTVKYGTNQVYHMLARNFLAAQYSWLCLNVKDFKQMQSSMKEISNRCNVLNFLHGFCNEGIWKSVIKNKLGSFERTKKLSSIYSQLSLHSKHKKIIGDRNFMIFLHLLRQADKKQLYEKVLKKLQTEIYMKIISIAPVDVYGLFTMIGNIKTSLILNFDTCHFVDQSFAILADCTRAIQEKAAVRLSLTLNEDKQMKSEPFLILAEWLHSLTLKRIVSSHRLEEVLSHTKSLHELNLSNTALDESHANVVVTHANQLQALNLKQCFLNKNSLETIAAKYSTQPLKKLDISGNKVAGSFHLFGGSQIQELVAQTCSVSSQQLDAFLKESCRHHTKFNVLNLSSNKNILKNLDDFSSLTNITCSLIMNNCNIDRRCLATFLGTPPETEMSALSLESNEIDDLCMDMITKSMGMILDINLSKNKIITEKGLQKLFDGCKHENSKVQTLGLNSINFAKWEPKMIESFGSLKKLEMLHCDVGKQIVKLMMSAANKMKVKLSISKIPRKGRERVNAPSAVSVKKQKLECTSSSQTCEELDDGNDTLEDSELDSSMSFPSSMSSQYLSSIEESLLSQSLIHGSFDESKNKTPSREVSPFIQSELQEDIPQSSMTLRREDPLNVPLEIQQDTPQMIFSKPASSHIHPFNIAAIVDDAQTWMKKEMDQSKEKDKKIERSSEKITTQLQYESKTEEDDAQASQTPRREDSLNVPIKIQQDMPQMVSGNKRSSHFGNDSPKDRPKSSMISEQMPSLFYVETSKLKLMDVIETQNKKTLVVLKYNWADPDIPFGNEGGQMYMSEKKDMELYPTILSCFEKFRAFLLPSTGRKNLHRKTDIFIKDCGKTFLQYFEQFVKDTLKQITLKTFNGHLCVGADLHDVIEELREMDAKYSRKQVPLPFQMHSPPHGLESGNQTTGRFESISGMYHFVHEASFVVGVKGSVIRVSDCVVEIPSGAIENDTVITLTTYCGKCAPKKDKDSLTYLLKCSPHGLTFKKPIQITLARSLECEQPIAVVIEESANGFHWRQHDHVRLMSGQQGITFNTTHFTFFQWVLDYVQEFMGFRKSKSLYIIKERGMLKCIISDEHLNIQDAKPTNCVLHDTFMLRRSQVSLNLKLTSPQLQFQPHEVEVQDGFCRPRVEKHFFSDVQRIEVRSRICCTILCGRTELYKNEFLSEDGNSRVVAKFTNEEWLEFARRCLHISEQDISGSQRHHTNAIKQRLYLLNIWLQQGENGIHRFEALVDDFFLKKQEQGQGGALYNVSST